MFGYFANVQMFRKFLLSYILILVMPLIAGFIVYQASIHRIMDYASENGRELLNQAISLVDKKLDDIESFTYQLSLHPEVHGLMLLSSRSDKDFAYNLYKVKNSIYPYWSTYFRNFYLYFNQIDTIVTPEAAYVRPEDYYRGHSYEGVDYEEWNKKINQTYLSRHYFPSMLANTGKRKEAVITYVQSIPPGSTSTPKANVVVMIDQKEIASLMGRISSQYGGSVSVFDNQHQLIYRAERVQIQIQGRANPGTTGQPAGFPPAIRIMTSYILKQIQALMAGPMWLPYQKRSCIRTSIIFKPSTFYFPS